MKLFLTALFDVLKLFVVICFVPVIIAAVALAIATYASVKTILIAGLAIAFVGFVIIRWNELRHDQQAKEKRERQLKADYDNRYLNH